MKTQSPKFVLLLVAIGIVAGLSQQHTVKKAPTPVKAEATVRPPGAEFYPTIVLSGSQSR